MADFEELVLPAQDAPFTSLDHTLEALLPTLRAKLWETCCWGDHPGVDWKIGDFRFLILSAQADAEIEIYLQWWSEPHERVLLEVSSGEWSPGTLKYVGKAQRDYLKKLGYEKGGRARNFRKEQVIATAGHAEAAATETIRILYEAFGYRGQWPVTLKGVVDGRSETAATYTSLTPEDLVKLAQAVGLAAHLEYELETEEPSIRLDRGRRRCVAILDQRVRDQNLYGFVGLRAIVRADRAVSDEELLALNDLLRHVRAQRFDGPEAIGVYLPISLRGGVTTDWLAAQLEDFFAGCKYVETALKGKRRSPSKRTDTRVH